jgi:hypothetical protein
LVIFESEQSFTESPGKRKILAITAPYQNQNLSSTKDYSKSKSLPETIEMEARDYNELMDVYSLH